MDSTRMVTKKRIILVLVVLALIIEAVWSWRSVGSLINRPPGKPIPPPVPKVEKTIISLSAPQNVVKIGQEFNVAVSIFSPSLTEGVDLVIMYDPGLLEIIPVKPANAPVALGTLYPSYPTNDYDSKTGRIHVSGISSSDAGVIPRGVLGFLTFKTKQAGEVKISIDYTPGRTTDSNVVELGTAKDLLNSVHDVSLKIVP